MFYISGIIGSTSTYFSLMLRLNLLCPNNSHFKVILRQDPKLLPHNWYHICIHVLRQKIDKLRHLLLIFKKLLKENMALIYINEKNHGPRFHIQAGLCRYSNYFRGYVPWKVITQKMLEI